MLSYMKGERLLMQRKYCYMVLLAAVFSFSELPAEAADLSIEDAVSMALAQNTSFKITKLGEETAAETLRKAQGTDSLSIALTTSMSTSDVDDTGTSTANVNGLNMSLPVYTGGRKEASVESGRIGMDIAALKTGREEENVRLNVITAYFDVLEAQKTIEVDQSSVDNYQNHFQNIDQLYKAGSKAKIDVLRSSVALSNARQELIRASSNYKVKESILRNLLNMDRDEPLHLTDDFSYRHFTSEMSYCLDYALQHRKDLLIDDYTVEQRDLAVKYAKAAYQPTVDVSLSAGWDKQAFPSQDNHNYTAGLNASWNIFDDGLTKSNVDLALTEAASARLTKQKDQENVDLALRQAYYNMREAEKRLNSTGDAVNQAEEDYFIAGEKYKAGEGIMLDIIDAQLALSTAKLNYISAQYDYARYKATVENAMGLQADTNAARQGEDNLVISGVDNMDAAALEAAIDEVSE